MRSLSPPAYPRARQNFSRQFGVPMGEVNEAQVSQVECKCRVRLEKKYTLEGINGVHRSLETVWARSFVPLIVESLMTFC